MSVTLRVERDGELIRALSDHARAHAAREAFLVWHAVRKEPTCLP